MDKSLSPNQAFSSLLQHHPLPTWVYDLSSLQIVAVNNAATKRYGYSRRAFLKLRLTDLHELDIAPGESYWGEWRHKTRTGEVFSAEVFSSPVRWQGKPAALVQARDLNAQQRTSRQARETWQRQVQLEEIVNRSPAIAFLWRNEPGLPMDFVSENIAQLGYSAKELTRPGALYDKLIHPADLEQASLEMQQAIGAHRLFLRQEYRVITKSKQIRWVEDYTRIQYDSAGYPLFFWGIVTDITQRKAAETRLRYQAALLENVSDAVIATDLDFIVSALNRAAEEMYGWQEIEAAGQRWDDLVHTEFFNQTGQETVADLMRNGFWSGLCSQSRKNGERFFVESRVTLLRDETGRPVGTVAVNRDINERVQAEQRLRASEERFRSLFNQASAGVARVSLDGYFVEVNQYFCDLLGYTREEMLSKTFQDVTHPDDIQRDLKQLRRALSGEIESYLLEKRYLRKDGRLLWVNLSATLVRDLNGQPEYLIGVVQDITERKMREREIDTIYQSGLEFDNLRSPEAIAQKLIEILATRLDWHHAGIWMRRENSDLLDLLAFSRSDGRDAAQAARRSAVLIRRVGDGMTGWVIANGKSVISNNLEDDPRFMSVHPNMRSGLYVPICIGEQTIGCISAESQEENAFDEHHRRLLETLAGQAASALVNTRLLQDARQRANQMETLVSVSQALSSAIDSPHLLQLTLESAIACIPQAQKGSVLLLDESGNRLIVGASFGYSQSNPLRAGLPRGKGYAWQAVETAQPLMVEDVAAFPSHDYFTDLPESREIRSSLAAPLLLENRPTGVICLDNTSHFAAFSADDLQLLTVFAASAAISLQNARLLQQTRRRAQELETLMNVSLAMRSATSPEELLNIIFQQMQGLFSISNLAYVSAGENADALQIQLATGIWQRFQASNLPQNSLAGQMLRSREYYLCQDARQDEKIVRRELLQGIRSLLEMPLIVQDRVVGSFWLGIGDEQQHPDFSPDDIRLLHAIADSTANALNRMSLHQRSLEHARRMAAIGALGRTLAESLSLEKMYKSLVEAIYDLLPDIGGVFISRFDPQEKIITCLCAHMDGEFQDVSGLARLPYAPEKGGRQSRVIASGKALVINDIPEWKNAHPNLAVQMVGDPSRTTRSALYVPMSANSQVIGVLQVQSYTPDRFGAEDIDLLSLAANTAAVELQNAYLYQTLQNSNAELRAAYDATILGWGQALELRDEETEGHSLRVTELALNLARRLNLTEEALLQMRWGCLLHDIGKLGIPDSILRKAGPLTTEEWEKMRQHPKFALNLMSKIEYLKNAMEIPYCHHEKWNGSGYPQGLRGEAIPLTARIFTLADVFDALTSDRPYRKALPRSEALEYIRAQSGKHFDPQLVPVFVEMLNADPGSDSQVGVEAR